MTAAPSEPLTLPALVSEGYAKNTTGVCLATRRDGVWHRMPCDDFALQVRAFALGLYDLGIRHGDRVALHAENSTAWMIVDQAVLSLGAVNVPIYPTQPGEQVLFILNDAEAKAYIASDAERFAALAPHLDALDTAPHLIGLYETPHPSMLSLEDVLARGRAAEKAEPGLYERQRAAVRPDDLASFIYTSGTTGMPKGVMLTHANIASNVHAALTRCPFDPEGDRGTAILSYLPLSHVFERMLTYLSMYIGFPIYFVEGINDLSADFETIRPVHFGTVPRLLEKVYHAFHARIDAQSGLKGHLGRWALGLADAYDVSKPMGPLERIQYALADRLVFSKFRDFFGGELRAITSGGAALAPKIMNFFNALGIFCGQGYGMTESSPVIAVYDRDDLRAGSVGKPITGVEVQIAEDGEIWARGPNIMKGYFNRPEATADVLTEDGWLKTGDIGHLDDDGFLYITDRKKALFKLSTGKYVAPQPLEVVLTTHPFVEQALVVGNEQKFCGALIVVNLDAIQRRCADAGRPIPDDLAADEELCALLQEALDAANDGKPHWEQVKRFCLLTSPFTLEAGELTPTLKPKRRVIHQRYADEIASMYG